MRLLLGGATGDQAQCRYVFGASCRPRRPGPSSGIRPALAGGTADCASPAHRRLARGTAKSLWPCGRQPYESCWSIRPGTCRWLAHRFFAGHPSRPDAPSPPVLPATHLHPHDPPALQFHEYPVEHTLARPPAHASGDAVPIAEAFRQASPLAPVFHLAFSTAMSSSLTLPRWQGSRPPMCSTARGRFSWVPSDKPTSAESITFSADTP